MFTVNKNDTRIIYIGEYYRRFVDLCKKEATLGVNTDNKLIFNTSPLVHLTKLYLKK